jgi:hypothetical protein
MGKKDEKWRRGKVVGNAQGRKRSEIITVGKGSVLSQFLVLPDGTISKGNNS